MSSNGLRNPHAGYGNCYEQAPVSCIDLLIAYQHAPVDTQKKPGVYTDGGGLYLRVKSETAKSWVFVWHVPTVNQQGEPKSKRREMGLGSTIRVSLAKARERAQRAREAVADGLDPVALKKAARAVPTFGEVADEFIKARSPSIRSDKSIARWERAIGDGGYAKALRTLRVDKITTADVVNVLKPMWQTHPSSAGLLRGYIEAVLNMAKGRRSTLRRKSGGWAGHLALILPARGKLGRGHHAAMPYSEVPEFTAALRAQDSLAAHALQLTILCATRTSETLQANWKEFDLNRAIWTIPADRMKAGKEHRIPLSKAAVRLLLTLDPGIGFVFPGRKADKPLSGMAMEMVLRRMKVDATVHGFRSSFRDWAGEMTDTPREVAEAALAHTVGNSAELAYRRGDALEKRRQLMELWGAFCGGAAKGKAAQFRMLMDDDGFGP